MYIFLLFLLFLFPANEQIIDDDDDDNYVIIWLSVHYFFFNPCFIYKISLKVFWETVLKQWPW